MQEHRLEPSFFSPILRHSGMNSKPASIRCIRQQIDCRTRRSGLYDADLFVEWLEHLRQIQMEGCKL